MVSTAASFSSVSSTVVATVGDGLWFHSPSPSSSLKVSFQASGTYIRDFGERAGLAAIGPRRVWGHYVAVQVFLLLLLPQRSIGLRSSLVKHKKLVGLVSAAAFEHLSERLALPSPGAKEMVWPEGLAPDALRRDINDILAELGVLSGVVEPSYVKAKVRGGRVHAVIQPGKTVCGWEYTAGKVAPVPSKLWPGLSAKARCDKCVGWS